MSTSQPVLENGKWAFPGTATSEKVWKQWNSGYTYHAWNLSPATKYYVILTPEPAPLLKSKQATGAFSTKKRKVTVTFEEIHLYNDSDAGSEKGDIT